MTLPSGHVRVQVLPYAAHKVVTMKRTVLLSLALAAIGSAALAQEAIATRGTDNSSPPPAAPVANLDEPTQNQAQAAEWARQVLARANGELPPTDERALPLAEAGQTPGKTGCVRNPDRSPHGEVSVAVGSSRLVTGAAAGGAVLSVPRVAMASWARAALPMAARARLSRTVRFMETTLCAA